MARGRLKGFRCRTNKANKRRCKRTKKGKISVIRTLVPNKRTRIRICRTKRKGRRGGRTIAYETCKKITKRR